MTAFPTAIVSISDDIARRRESMRSVLAWMIIGSVMLMAVLITSYLWAQGDPDGTQLLMAGIFTPLIGIAGTVLGFYFGEQSKNSN